MNTPKQIVVSAQMADEPLDEYTRGLGLSTAVMHSVNLGEYLGVVTHTVYGDKTIHCHTWTVGAVPA